MEMRFRFFDAEKGVITHVLGEHLAQLKGLQRQEHQIG